MFFRRLLRVELQKRLAVRQEEHAPFIPLNLASRRLCDRMLYPIKYRTLSQEPTRIPPIANNRHHAPVRDPILGRLRKAAPIPHYPSYPDAYTHVPALPSPIYNVCPQTSKPATPSLRPMSSRAPTLRKRPGCGLPFPPLSPARTGYRVSNH